MFRKIDCLLLRVPDLNAALEFYRNRLGLELSWRRGSESAGLKMQDSDSELVLIEEPGTPETDLLVESVEDACRKFEEAGGTVVERPFDISVGRCAVVKDPWDNSLVLLDLSKGPLRTDGSGNVID
jgi:predicted enzyme related to lactoylglutathione lyase